MNIAGLSKNPGNVAGIFSQADAGVASGGSAGDASQFQWLQARMSAIPGLTWNANGLAQSAGLLTDLGDVFGPNSAAYKMALRNGDSKTIAEYNAIAKGASGKTNLQLGMSRAKYLAGGNSALEIQNIMGMFGLNNQQHAAALNLIANSDTGLGGFERRLAGYGIDVGNMNTSQIGAMAELVSGGTNAFKSKYAALKAKGALSGKEGADIEAAIGRGGYGSEFEKLILNAASKDSMDEGLKNQLTQIELTRKISESLTSLVSIEGDARNMLIALAGNADKKSPAIKAFSQSQFSALGLSVAGLDIYGNSASKSQSLADAIGKMRSAGSMEEKEQIADAMMKQIHAESGEGYPSEAMKILTDEKRSPVLNQSRAPAYSTYAPTISGNVSPAMKAAKLSDSQFSVLGGLSSKYGIDPSLLPMVYSLENSKAGVVSTKGALGEFQIMPGNAAAYGVDATTFGGGAEAAAHVLADATRRYGGNRDAILAYYNGGARAGDAVFNGGAAPSGETRSYLDRAHGFYDQMPASQAKQEQSRLHATIGGTFRLIDSVGKQVADAINISTSFGAPVPAGAY